MLNNKESGLNSHDFDRFNASLRSFSQVHTQFKLGIPVAISLRSMNWIISIKEMARWTFQLCELVALITLELVAIYQIYKALGLIA